jgi:3-deoxy-D-manno-octulosonate 8-phosphate phosphatase (KDO 8-P phosphatase)
MTAKPPRALVLDVDGVLTDGGILLDGEGNEWKRFHVHDGVGIRLAQDAGWRVLFLTARQSPPARRRAEELGAEWAIGVAKKDAFLEMWLGRQGIGWDETAFVGDDLQDLPVLRRVAWPIAVSGAVTEVKEAARHVTVRNGGEGAVREAVEWLLEQCGLRREVIDGFGKGDAGFSVGAADSRDPRDGPAS